jgi:psp operon transcriptional activator
VGSPERLEVDVRIIAATNADLPELASNGRFKQDLIDRLSFEVLFVPPLRARKGDILLLANHFARRMAYELNRDEMPTFSERAMTLLESYSWPGNVRELKNLVERAVYRSESSLINEIVFNPFSLPFESPPDTRDKESEDEKAVPPVEDLMGKPFEEAVTELKVRLLKNALHQAKYNQKQAARLMGLTYHQFRGIYRKYSKIL